MFVSRRAARALTAFSLCLAALAGGTPASGSIGLQLTTTERQQLQREARLVIDLLQNHHYSGRAFRELENTEMLARFLEELDPEAYFLSREDWEHVRRRFGKTLKSVYLFRGDLQPAFEIFDLFTERARVRLEWIERRLGRDFDLEAAEPSVLSAKAEVASASAGDAIWESRLRDQVLAEILAGRSPDDARAAVARRYAAMGRQIQTFDSFTVRERFFDAIIRSFDPHSGYFSADSTREFEVGMENAVVGLGLDLQRKEGKCLVAGIQAGGPADLQSDLAPGDVVLALAEETGEWTDTSQLRMREIAARVRGKSGGKLRLAYQAEGGNERREIVLERARVVLSADRVHGAISEVPAPTGGIRRIGWIDLPDFYTGGDGPEKTSAARDMRELIEYMVAQKIDALVLDLRSNPGGALTEAEAICELFLPRGLMMLSRGPDGKVREHLLKEGTPAYAGPLVVLTSGASASASEIFAGAMRFHRRALIVGGASTYGKGTAQNYIPLAKLPGIDPRSAGDWGTLRLTSERFYLPDGSAVQRRGVPSQVLLPGFDPPDFKREESLPHALPAEDITPPSPAGRPDDAGAAAPERLVVYLRSVAERNFKELPEWNLWREEQQYAVEVRSRPERPLQLAVRRAEWEKQLARYQQLQGRRRTLTDAAAYRTEPFEIAAVSATLAAHEAKLQAAPEPPLHRLQRGGFHIRTDHGRLREIRLSDLNPAAYLADVPALAEAFSTAAGRPLDAVQARGLLEQLALLENQHDQSVLATAARLAGGPADPAAMRRGLEGMLQHLATLDREMHRERPGLDIPLREALRLAAAWAAQPPSP